ncbi:16869_t:CDS:1, partial [Funneliformis caledonium]
ASSKTPTNTKTFQRKSIDLTTSTKTLSLPIDKDIEVASIHSDDYDDHNDHDDRDD